MKIYFFSIVWIFLILSACVQKDTNTSHSNLVLISDSDGFEDKRFNSSVKRGLEKSTFDLNLKIDEIDIKGKDFVIVLNEQLKLNRKAIFIINPDNPQFLLKAVKQNPQIQFIVIGVTLEEKYNNLKCIDYKIDNVACVTGYIAAVFADIKLPRDGKVSFLHYTDSRRNLWLEGFKKGVSQFNSDNKKSVEFIDQIVEEKRSDQFILSLINQLSKKNVIVYFIAIGEKNQIAYKGVRENGKYIVGQEVDFFYIYPELQDITITSGIINVENYMYSFLKDLNKGEADFTNYVGTFENSGIDIAPFHSFEMVMSNKVKSDISNLKISFR